MSLCSPEEKGGSTFKYMVCAKCLLYNIYIYIDDCWFLSDWHFAINLFSFLSNAGISPAGLSVYLKSRLFPSIFTQTPDESISIFILFVINTLRGGGGGGFRPIVLQTLILRYDLKENARTCPEILGWFLGPFAQFYPCEASEQQWGQIKKNRQYENKSSCP